MRASTENNMDFEDHTNDNNRWEGIVTTSWVEGLEGIAWYHD